LGCFGSGKLKKIQFVGSFCSFVAFLFKIAPRPGVTAPFGRACFDEKFIFEGKFNQKLQITNH
jgi:hypothetical protein